MGNDLQARFLVFRLSAYGLSKGQKVEADTPASLFIYLWLLVHALYYSFVRSPVVFRDFSRYYFTAPHRSARSARSGISRPPKPAKVVPQGHPHIYFGGPPRPFSPTQSCAPFRIGQRRRELAYPSFCVPAHARDRSRDPIILALPIMH